MPTFKICNQHSGFELGDYQARDVDDALDVMARDAGYSDFRASCSITLYSPYTESDLDAEVDRCRAELIVTQIAD